MTPGQWVRLFLSIGDEVACLDEFIDLGHTITQASDHSIIQQLPSDIIYHFSQTCFLLEIEPYLV